MLYILDVSTFLNMNSPKIQDDKIRSKTRSNMQIVCEETNIQGKMICNPKMKRDFKFLLTVDMGPIRQMYKEYFVYDIFNLVGTVGGTLSLFVGFSFYDFVVVIIDFLFDKFEKACISFIIWSYRL